MRFRAAIPLFVIASTFAVETSAATPVGYLDAAGCDELRGWAQDPDVPDQPIAVHFYYGGPAGSGAPATTLIASVYREDLCTAIGSCEHGFLELSPFSLHDGQPHAVHAYGIDANGRTNPELGSSPGTLTCPPAVAPGEKRRLDGGAVADAWKFQSFWDLMPLDGPTADGLPEGEPLPEAPILVRGDGDPDTLWLDDNGVRREVPAAAIVTWRFDTTTATTVPASELDAMVLGTPLRARPVLFTRQGLFIVDDPQPRPSEGGAGGGMEGGGAEGGGPASGGGGGGSSESGCSAAHSGPDHSSLATMALALCVALLRRRS